MASGEAGTRGSAGVAETPVTSRGALAEVAEARSASLLDGWPVCVAAPGANKPATHE